MNEGKEITCCTDICEIPLDAAFWNDKYETNQIGWDLGLVSPPIQSYFEKVENKNAKILIPGCGNCYEAECLLQLGYKNITLIDIAPLLVENLKKAYKDNPNINIILGDFFEHQGKYDYIVEQTFFCALPPFMRQQYVAKMHQLLGEKGKLVGLLFNRDFEGGPPFGGSQNEYENLFKEAFFFHKVSTAENSVAPRANSELFIEFEKNNSVEVSIYDMSGITCNSCKNTITEKLVSLENVLNASINTALNKLLIVNKPALKFEQLEEAIAYDKKYKITKP